MKPELKAELIRKLEALEGITDDERAALLGLLRTNRTYGLVWEDKPEDIEETLREQLPVLREVKDKAIIAAENHTEVQNTPPVNSLIPNHLIIEGDNLVSLSALAYTHAGKIDVIYIDPPYNTGNKDFVYNDSFVDKEDAYRHSKWLSFMDRRLRIAKKLLSDRGVIFISIDDNEQANLKLLCDEVFLPQNYISSIPWHSRQSLQNDTDLSINHEYLLCFAKKRRVSNRRLKASNADKWYEDEGFVFYPIKVDNDKYSNPDNDPRGPWKADPMDAPHIRPNLTYTITNPKTGSQHLPPGGRCWRISQEKFSSALADNRILFGKSGNSRPQLKVFLCEQEQYGSISHSWFEAEKYGTATHGSKELQSIFGGDKVFTSPKPTSLIRELLKLTSLPDKPITILDFFAGSGTTLHAVMQLNAEDGGHRQCILCTNNENGICENVTYERNKRVIRGYTKPNGEKVEGLHDNNLRYYRTEFISRSRTPRNMQRLVELATDMLCIKEDLYAEQPEMGGMRVVPRVFRYFAEGERKMLIIYREEYIEEIVRLIAKVETTAPIRVYVFSPCEDPSSELFEPVAEKVEPVALPAAIYNTYKRILPKRRDRRVDTAADNAAGVAADTEPDNELGGLFETQDQA